MINERSKIAREIINRPGLVQIPSCTDALSALICQKLGYEIISISGSGMIASTLGIPDTGLATATEMIARGRQIAASVHIPVFCDADTGFGNINNVRRTVKEFEIAGISGIHIEDQTLPKRFGELNGVGLVSSEEMEDKIRVACQSRTDENFIIIGRTDCYTSMGIDEVIRRSKILERAGADVIYAHNIIDREHLKKLAHSITNTPLVYDVIDARTNITDKELADMGFKIVFHGRATAMVQAKAVMDLWKHYKECGEMASQLDKMLTSKQWDDLIDIGYETGIRDWMK